MKPAALALAALFAAVPPPLDGDAAGPCEVAPDRIVCEWVTDTQQGAQAFALDPSDLGRVYFDLPVLARALVTVSVETRGSDQGWSYAIYGRDGGARNATLTYEWRPDPSTRPVTRSVATHFVETDDALPHELGFWSYGGMVPSVAEFRVRYVAEPALDGVPPARPAATRADPHLLDDVGDGTHPALDVTAAWLDDAALDDLLLDAHLAVADLSDLAPLAAEGARAAYWDLEFDLGGTRYLLRWRALATCPIDGPVACVAPQGFDGARFDCGLFLAAVPGGANAGTIAGTADGLVTLTVPRCRVDADDGTFHAVFPERALKDPGPGQRFENMRVAVRVDRPHNAYQGNDASFGIAAEDEAGPERYAFALGGPAVWSGLNPRLDPPVPAWYERPLAAENLPNTLQVLGALAAAVVFLGGLAVVARRRRRVRALLAEVERIVRANAGDARAGLAALGAFEDELDARLERGKLTESEYQTIAHRVARAASRLAMRRDLGLDDGAPGDAPDIPVPR